jgi:hypothetical protein
MSKPSLGSTLSLAPHHSQICCFPPCLARQGFLNAKPRSRRRAAARSPRAKEFMINRSASATPVVAACPRRTHRGVLKIWRYVRSTRYGLSGLKPQPPRKRHGGDLISPPSGCKLRRQPTFTVVHSWRGVSCQLEITAGSQPAPTAACCRGRPPEGLYSQGVRNARLLAPTGAPDHLR